MTNDAPQSRLHGIIPPLVTPLQDGDTLDIQGAERLIDHVIAGGVHGLFILGTTGEAPSLSYGLRRDFIRMTCGYVDGRVPVYVGITDTAFVESVAMAHTARESGASAVVLATPYYFPAGQTELLQYVTHIASALPLPLVLYNMPSLTKVWFELKTLQKLSELEPIIGVKDSSGDLDYFGELVQLKKLRPDWSVLMGPEHLLPASMHLGGDGGVNGGANIYPRLFVQCYEAVRSGDTGRIEVYQREIEALQAIYAIGKYASRYIKATKCALSLRGICADHMAEPFNHFLKPERERVAAILDQLEERGIANGRTGHCSSSVT